MKTVGLTIDWRLVQLWNLTFKRKFELGIYVHEDSTTLHISNPKGSSGPRFLSLSVDRSEVAEKITATLCADLEEQQQKLEEARIGIEARINEIEYLLSTTKRTEK